MFRRSSVAGSKRMMSVAVAVTSINVRTGSDRLCTQSGPVCTLALASLDYGRNVSSARRAPVPQVNIYLNVKHGNLVTPYKIRKPVSRVMPNVRPTRGHSGERQKEWGHHS